MFLKQRYKKGQSTMKTAYYASMIAAATALLAFSNPVLASKADSRIESSVKQSYVFKTYLKDDAIKVDAKDGVVSLTGTVANESHKLLAQETVAVISEVKSVNNQLEIKGDRPAEKSDAWLLTKVKTTLLFHRSVSAKTEVDVKDGTVTLRGEAANLAQKELTSEYVKDVEGVNNIKNEMTVAGAPAEKRTVGDKVDDASITAQVKVSLLLHRSTSALKTTVTTKEGVVTVSGKAKNTAEKDLVSKLANDVNGAMDVKNRMTIE